MSLKRTVPLVATAVFLGSFVFYALYYNRGVILADEGSLVRPAQRILRGEIPYRDFYHFYAPGRFYLLAGLFKILGEKFLISRWMWVVVRSVAVLLVFLIAKEIMPVGLSLLPAAVVLSVPGPWFKSFYPFCGLLTFWGILKYVDHPTRLRIILLGSIIAIALYFRQDTGIYALVLSLLAIGWCNGLFPSRNFRRTVFHIFLLGVTVFLWLVPYLLYMAQQKALVPLYRQLFLLAPRLTLSLAGKAFKFLEGKSLFGIVYFLGPPLLILLAPVSIFFIPEKKERIKMVILILLAALTLFPAYLPPALSRLFQSYHFSWILLVYLLYRITRGCLTFMPRKRGGGWSVVVAALVYSIIIIFPAFFIFHVYTSIDREIKTLDFSGTFLIYFKNNHPCHLRGEQLYLAKQKARRLEKLVRYIRQYTRSGEPILILPTQSLLYYFCDRPNPTRFVGNFAHRYASGDGIGPIGEEHAREVEKSNARYLIVQKNLYSGGNSQLKKYLKLHYERVESIGRFNIMRRKEG